MREEDSLKICVTWHSSDHLKPKSFVINDSPLLSSVINAFIISAYKIEYKGDLIKNG